jgi:putative transcriptional regulator
MEKSWENMMGEDWREFRARLVARERASVGGETTSSPGDQKKQQQRQQLTAREDASSSSSGGIFGAITSMFSNKGGGESSPSSSDAATATRARRTRGKDDPPADIFDGDAVGGATRFSKIGMSSSSYSACSDPFMDEEECHIIYDEPNVKIDKHRWAHPLFHVEPGCILVANEKLGGVFHQTVVLIIDHNEAAGSTGMVINRCVLLITFEFLLG